MMCVTIFPMGTVCKEHAGLNPDYGSCAPLHFPIGIDPRILELNEEAFPVRALAEAMAEYSSALSAARAALKRGDERAAERCKARGRAAIARWPEVGKLLVPYMKDAA